MRSWCVEGQFAWLFFGHIEIVTCPWTREYGIVQGNVSYLYREIFIFVCVSEADITTRERPLFGHSQKAWAKFNIVIWFTNLCHTKSFQVQHKEKLLVNCFWGQTVIFFIENESGKKTLEISADFIFMSDFKLRWACLCFCNVLFWGVEFQKGHADLCKESECQSVTHERLVFSY